MKEVELATVAKTIPLYDESPYGTEFQARVVSCVEIAQAAGEGVRAGAEIEGEKRYALVLDQTMFFPEQGGQTPDKGVLYPGAVESGKESDEDSGRDSKPSPIRVLDVQIQNGIITHTTDAPLPAGETVRGKIDWGYRFSNMQQHSGEHIFSGLVHSIYGYDNVGFHLSDDVVTVDFNGSLSDVQVAEVEMCANKVIYENLEIQVSYPTAEEEQKLSYRSKKELEGQIRIVTIPGVDVCACCAPHVRNTGEIGILKVMNRQNYKGGVRISILCGKRALEAFRKKDELLTSLVKQLSTREEDLPDRMQQLQQERQALQFDLGKTRQKLAWLKLQEQVQKRTAKTQEGASAAETTYLLFEDAMDAKDMRLVINRFLKEYRGVCGIFAGNDAAGYHYILGANHRDCNEVATVMREKLHAKGGGNAQMIQGSVNARQQDIISALQS